MENLLHSGINFEKVKEQYNRIMGIPFPETPESDELYDLFSELVELDEYVMGVVSSFIKTKQLNKNLLYCDKEFNRILYRIRTNSRELDNMLYYKGELEKLIALCQIR